jgi:shikimate dehydrogenase
VTRFVVGLIGADLGEPLSRPLHEREADEWGVRYLYQLIDLDVLGLNAEDVGELVIQARRLGFAGLDLTRPANHTVVKYLDELTPEAAALGAVNTVVFQRGRAIGHNTDWSSFRDGWCRGLPGAAAGEVVVLGAGRAGTAAAFALVRLGARRLTVVDVVLERAEHLAAVVQHSIGDPDRVTIEAAYTVDDVLDQLGAAEGLVNATPVGTPIPNALLRPDLWVADLTYRPRETELLAQARRVGGRTLNGGGIAVSQAAQAFHLVTGLTPDVERMHRHFTTLTAPDS